MTALLLFYIDNERNNPAFGGAIGNFREKIYLKNRNSPPTKGKTQRRQLNATVGSKR